ncbi:MAG: beta-ketoacyl synthase chain length factor, partial [Holosporaceae bacterium]|nr:beta-ketoacyl synthase chain length factor [Holosporaceae bacterium]
MFISIKKWNICERNDVILDFIPPLAKRGLNEICRIALSSFYQLRASRNASMVCASQFGSWQQIIKLAERFYLEQEFSPAAFSKIPHNTFAGIISILNKNTLPYTAIAAGDKTFEMGLVETMIQEDEEIIYTYAEESTPEILQNFINVKPSAFSMLISKNQGDYNFLFTHNRNVKVKTVY